MLKKWVEVYNQEGMVNALNAGDLPILVGDTWYSIEGDQHVQAWESSHVEAWESSHVEAFGNSYVVARGSSRVEARGSSHVVARESSHVIAYENSRVEASKCVPVQIYSLYSQVTGGIQIKIEYPKTAEEWCEFYGVKVDAKTGIAVLFKAVHDDYRSAHNFLYLPGTTPEAPDWDGGRAECGGGLHFSPHPVMAHEFDFRATRFMACPVRVKDIVVHKDAGNPSKVKAPRTALPIWECDRYGKPVSLEQGGS